MLRYAAAFLGKRHLELIWEPITVVLTCVIKTKQKHQPGMRLVSLDWLEKPRGWLLIVNDHVEHLHLLNTSLLSVFLFRKYASGHTGRNFPQTFLDSAI